MFRNLAVMAALTILALAPRPACSQSGRSEADRKVTLKYENASVVVVLKDLFTQAHTKYKLSLTSPGRVSLSLTGVTVKLALENILQAATLDPPATYRIEKGIYIVEQKKRKPSGKANRQSENAAPRG